MAVETHKAIASSWRSGCRPVDRRPIGEWAAQHVTLPPAYAIPGRFNANVSRYLIGPMQSIADELVREETIIAPVQTGKTLIIDVSLPWIIANAPGPIMWTWQSDEDAKEHCYTRAMTVMRECQPVASLMPTGNRHAMQTTAIYFGDFWLLVNGANINNLQGKSVRWKINSEVWLWEQGLLSEARARVSAFEKLGTSKVINESQPGVQETAPGVKHDLYQAWCDSRQAVWHIPCRCGAMLPLEFFGRMEREPDKHACVVWDNEARRDDGTWDRARAAASARFRCPKCGYEWTDSAETRAEWNDRGQYIDTNPSAPYRLSGHRWTQVLTHPIAGLVDEWLVASEQLKRGAHYLAERFYTKKLAMFWRKETEREKVEIKPSDYTQREINRDPKATIDGEVLRVATMDRQRDHRWLLIRAFRADGSSRRLYYGKILTAENANEVAARFGIEPQLVFQDAQYETGKVYDECALHGWTALHGSGDDWFWHQTEDGRREQRMWSKVEDAVAPSGGSAPYIFWASEPIKDMLASLRGGGGAKWEIPSDAEPEYMEQLFGDAKKEKISKTTGRAEWRWVKVGPNHAWDCEAMAIAVACMMRIFVVETKRDESKNHDNTKTA